MTCHAAPHLTWGCVGGYSSGRGALPLFVRNGYIHLHYWCEVFAIHLHYWWEVSSALYCLL